MRHTFPQWKGEPSKRTTSIQKDTLGFSNQIVSTSRVQIGNKGVEIKQKICS